MIHTNKEIELKTMVTSDQFAKLLTYYPGNKCITQINHYYHSLSKPSSYFRLREIGDSWLFTYKERIVEGRLEYEKNLSSPDLNDPDLIAQLSKWGIIPPFIEEAKLTTQRTEILLPGEAYLCFDHNYYSNLEDYEIEYEFCGSLASQERFEKLLSQADIVYIPSVSSKMKRALTSLNSPQ